jgi:mono/diheme cytochrome c family protein
MKLKVIMVIGALVMIAGVFSSCQSDADLNFKRYYTSGQVLYQNHCQNCHATNGEGLGALIPPLNDSVYLKTNLHRLPCFIKNGIQGNITVNGKPYNQQMPAHNDLSPIEMAQVLTYVNNSFNNKLGLFDEQQVNDDLQKCSF